MPVEVKNAVILESQNTIEEVLNPKPSVEIFLMAKLKKVDSVCVIAIDKTCQEIYKFSSKYIFFISISGVLHRGTSFVSNILL